MNIKTMPYLLLIFGLIPLLLCQGNPVPDRTIYCFQNHAPRGSFGRCDTEQPNPNDLEGSNRFGNATHCCAQADAAGFTENRSGTRCSTCSSLEEIDPIEGVDGDIDADVDGGWTDWDGWSTCSVTCGEGVRTKTRTCTNPAPRNNGRDCGGAAFKTKDCDEGSCAVNGNWGEWGEFSECSASCGIHLMHTRTRECNNPAPINGGLPCEGDREEVSSCDLPNCPIDGVWTRWGQWSECSATCGNGRQSRNRQCNDPSPQFGGQDCPGQSEESIRCSVEACPIDGGWSQWGEWGLCSSTVCNQTGVQLRFHYCNNPRPRHGGSYCRGSSRDVQQCINTEACPVDGGFGDWGEWGDCSDTCGTLASQTRKRPCNNPAAKNGGQQCIGRDHDSRGCPELPPCPTEAPNSGDCDDEDDCENSGSGSTPIPSVDPCAHIEDDYTRAECVSGHDVDVDPCAHIEDDYTRAECVSGHDVDVPGNDEVTMTPTPPAAGFNADDYSVSSLY